MLGIDPSTGKIWFQSAPKPEHVYKFTVMAMALNGQVKSKEAEFTISIAKGAGIKVQETMPDPEDRNAHKLPDAQELGSTPFDDNQIEQLTNEPPPLVSPDVI